MLTLLLFIITEIVLFPIRCILFIPKMLLKIDWKQAEKNRKQRVLNKKHDYDNMSGEEFENYVAYILGRTGYTNVKVTATSGDYGVDILASKDGKKYAYQCKRYSKPVGNHAIQEVFSGKVYYDADEAVVITTNYFTPAAINTANKLKVSLVNRDGLNMLIKQVKKTEVNIHKQTKQSSIHKKQRDNDYSTKKVPKSDYIKERSQKPIGESLIVQKRPMMNMDYSSKYISSWDNKRGRPRITSKNAKDFIRRF